MILREFKVMQIFWLNCVTELTTDAINECQRDASRLIRASSAKFMLFNEKKTVNASLDSFSVRRLEAAFFPFRDYVTLSVNVMTTLMGSYAPKAKTCEDLEYTKKFKTFVQEQINDIKEFRAYALWAFKQFVFVHTNNGVAAPITCKKVRDVLTTGSVIGVFDDHFNDEYECKSVFDATLVRFLCLIL